MLEGLVEQHVPGGCVRLEDDLARAQTLSSHAGALQFDAAAEAQLDEDAAPQAARYAVVPERCVALGVEEEGERRKG